jgi:hypothetical protein
MDLAGLEMGLFASGGTGRLPPFLYIYMHVRVRAFPVLPLEAYLLKRIKNLILFYTRLFLLIVS